MLTLRKASKIQISLRPPNNMAAEFLLDLDLRAL